MKIHFVSLGCDKNLVDSERMIAQCASAGYEFTDDPSVADIIVVNSCCFIDSAKEESINELLSMAEYKTEGHLQCLVLAGCMAERYAKEVEKELPEVDVLVNVSEFTRVAEHIEEFLKENSMEVPERISAADEGARSISTTGHFEYLKIAEGCDKRCTYCAIPYIRGSYKSVPMIKLLNEARYLAEQGVKELILVAQETSNYGVDLYGEKKLSELLHKLCEIDGLKWIRIMYCYPEEIDDELIQTIKSEEKICHYLDIPIQHASNEVLRRMGRRCSREQLEEVINTLRSEIPDIAIRTTLITGFPGESEEDFRQLLSFVEEKRFDRLGCFTYSREEGTPAADFEGQLPDKIKAERRDVIMELQQEIVFEDAEKLVGRELEVLIEGALPEDRVYVGRTYRDAPDVDGYIFVDYGQTGGALVTGDMVRVRVTGTHDYDLVGEIVS
ncbi:MAG: 30S ribosomal protein S12 methylthiotransferase RimO [Lachnospiraceae bacterium]|nr:30S ribosomal protein S12 methylthiotransferase RimO [Lachnospiraceae bacterium]